MPFSVVFRHDDVLHDTEIHDAGVCSENIDELSTDSTSEQGSEHLIVLT